MKRVNRKISRPTIIFWLHIFYVIRHGCLGVLMLLYIVMI